MATKTKLWTPDSSLAAKVIPAAHFSVGRGGTKPTLIVMHTAETSEVNNSAEGTAGWFAGGAGGRPSSTHYAVDIDGVIQMVKEKDRAFGAPQLNYCGIHIEQAGKAAQGPAQWGDGYSMKMLRNQVIPLVADICRRRGIPPVFKRMEDFLKGDFLGISTHAESTRYCRKLGKPTSGHTDPGKDYPMQMLLDGVAKELNK